MTMHSGSLLAAPTRALVILLGWLVLAGCAPSLVRVLREDPHQPGSYTRDGGARIAGALSIIRNGRALDANLPAMLQPGDVLQTGPDAAAVIRYPNGTEIILDTNTRARFGSLFVEFGRILARVQGLFEVDTENVVTGVEGTEYVLHVARDGSVKVVVFDGVVVCRSRTGAWNSVRLHRGEAFLSDFPNRAAPQARPATRNELEDARSWIYGGAGGSLEPVPIGYCCEEARVRRSTPDECRGVFSRSEKEAVVRCEQAQSGYCCSDGAVSRATRSRCAGRFFLNRNAAYEQCRPPVETGYCCNRGKVFEANHEECVRNRGEFFTSGAEVERACSLPPDSGYCCNRGDVFSSTRSRCAGSFFLDRNAAYEQCRPPVETGYCCSRGKVFEANREECVRHRGEFFTSGANAERACSSPPDSGYCCNRGDVFASTRDACERAKGRFYVDRSGVESACTQPRAETGYCCDRGKSYATTRDRCARVKGSFFDDRKAAEHACAPPVEKGYCCDDGKTYATTRDRCERAKGRFYEDRKEAERACRPAPSSTH